MVLDSSLEKRKPTVQKSLFRLYIHSRRPVALTALAYVQHEDFWVCSGFPPLQNELIDVHEATVYRTKTT